MDFSRDEVSGSSNGGSTLAIVLNFQGMYVEGVFRSSFWTPAHQAFRLDDLGLRFRYHHNW